LKKLQQLGNEDRLLIIKTLMFYLKRKFIKIESVTHVIVGADCFRVAVHHDGLVAKLLKHTGRIFTQKTDTDNNLTVKQTPCQ